MLLMIDNYDSFTYNLVQYFAQLGEEVRVFRNDEITLEAVQNLHPQRIVISPGPCTPFEAGISVPVIEHFAGKIPLLGVCLGIKVLVRLLAVKLSMLKKSCMARLRLLPIKIRVYLKVCRRLFWQPDTILW